jgi:hypothetical protein
MGGFAFSKMALILGSLMPSASLWSAASGMVWDGRRWLQQVDGQWVQV